MKIRQALKLYNKSKSTLLKCRNIHECGTMLNGYTLKFRQGHVITNMRDTTYKYLGNGNKIKSHRYFYHINNQGAFKRIKKYLKNNESIRFIDFYKLGCVTFEVILKDTPKYLDNLPKVSDTCYVYDDGKVKLSREDQVTIINIYQFDSAPDDIKELWREGNVLHYWIFTHKTDYIIQAKNRNDETIYFARKIDGGWFSLGDSWTWMSGTGLLDTTGELHNKLVDEYRNTIHGGLENLKYV